LSFSHWLSWCSSVIVSAVDWLTKITLLNVPVLYILLAIFVMGVVIRAIPFRA
jgi:steroid 5-alpha reductase family enzyme